MIYTYVNKLKYSNLYFGPHLTKISCFVTRGGLWALYRILFWPTSAVAQDNFDNFTLSGGMANDVNIMHNPV